MVDIATMPLDIEEDLLFYVRFSYYCNYVGYAWNFFEDGWAQVPALHYIIEEQYPSSTMDVL